MRRAIPPSSGHRLYLVMFVVFFWVTEAKYDINKIHAKQGKTYAVQGCIGPSVSQYNLVYGCQPRQSKLLLAVSLSKVESAADISLSEITMKSYNIFIILRIIRVSYEYNTQTKTNIHDESSYSSSSTASST